MKYILTLSLSAICLAIFIFVIQGNAVSAVVDFESLLNPQSDAGAAAVKLEAVSVAEKRPMTRNEAIREAVKGRPWEEAKPDVIKILKDYSKKRGKVRRGEDPVKRRGTEAGNTK